jgi:hypothetical protein
MATYKELIGSTVYDMNGDKIGTLDSFYIDEDTEKPRWLTVKTGLFGTKLSFVPLALARESEGGLQVAVSKDQVNDAPRIEEDGELSDDEGDMLRDYYKGVVGDNDQASDEERADETPADTDNVTAADTDDDGHDDEDTDDVDEHETIAAPVGNAGSDNIQPKAGGQVRLKKYVVTENVTFTVPVQREEVRVVHEGEDDDDDGGVDVTPERDNEGVPR